AVTDASQWKELTGQLHGEMLGLGWLDAIHPDDRPRTTSTWAAAMEMKTSAIGEHRIRHADGSCRWMMATAVPILGPAGEIAEGIGTVSDIDARKRAELDRHRYVSLAENSSEFIALCDLSYRPFFVNAAGLAKVGLDTLEDARRVEVGDFFFPEDRA